MKNKAYLSGLIVAVITSVICRGNLYSQNVISTINVNQSTEAIGEKFGLENEESTATYNKSENWLNNKNYLHQEGSIELLKILFSLIEKPVEQVHEIEEWMVQEGKWRVNKENEEENIADWMIKGDHWLTKPSDEGNEIEDWMISSAHWLLNK